MNQTIEPFITKEFSDDIYLSLYGYFLSYCPKIFYSKVLHRQCLINEFLETYQEWAKFIVYKILNELGNLLFKRETYDPNYIENYLRLLKKSFVISDDGNMYFFLVKKKISIPLHSSKIVEDFIAIGQLVPSFYLNYEDMEHIFSHFCRNYNLSLRHKHSYSIGIVYNDTCKQAINKVYKFYLNQCQQTIGLDYYLAHEIAVECLH